MSRINTDEIVESFGRWDNFADVVKAGKIAVKQIAENFDKGQSFCQETTLCGSDILRNIRKAKISGYRVILYYVGVNSAEIAKERVQIRVQNGGHGISDEDIDRRYNVSLEKLSEVIPLCDEVIVYDNTTVYETIAIYKDGKLAWQKASQPEWFRTILQNTI